MQTFQWGFSRPIHRRWQEIDDGIQERNGPDILERRTTIERDDRAGLDAKAKLLDEVFLRQLPRRKILFQQSVITLGYRLLNTPASIPCHSTRIFRYRLLLNCRSLSA